MVQTKYCRSRMILNRLGFRIYLNQNKYDWISLKHARICLKFNVKNTVKLLQKLDRIYEKQMHSELYQTSRMELLRKIFNMVLSIYPEVWIYFLIGIYQGTEYARDTKSSKYVWVCSWIMFKYVWICLKQNLQ